MSPENVKRLYMGGLFLWCVGLAAMPVLAMHGYITGTTALTIAGIYSALYLGSYVILHRSGKV